jgi:DNA-binding response OmpR family regulator
MSVAARHAELLARRLRAMGIAVETEPGATWLRGSLELSSSPFDSLTEPLRIERAAFYTLGHGRLKFYQPRILFDLPAIEVGACETRLDVERALRRAWQTVQRDLLAARGWLEGLGSSVHVARHGTRLRLASSGRATGEWEVRSAGEIQLGSFGALAKLAVGEPGERRFRPPRGIERSGELDLALERATADWARRCAQRPTAVRAMLAGAAGDSRARVLALASDPELLHRLGARLPELGIAVECLRDPEQTLATFHLQSFDAVIAETRVGRTEGLELALRIREIPGVEDLPVALIDSRDNAALRASVAQVGSLTYAVKPMDEGEIAELLADLLDHVTRRRFRRFPARFSVHAAGASVEDRTEQIARGGICLRTVRDLALGTCEPLAIALPAPRDPVRVHARVVSRAAVPGSATLLAGMRFAAFEAGSEASWIDVIETLARREREKDPRECG